MKLTINDINLENKPDWANCAVVGYEHQIMWQRYDSEFNIVDKELLIELNSKFDTCQRIHIT
jgi:hypothetical protein